MYTAYNLLYKLVALVIRVILRINGGIEIIGKDNIPEEGGALIAPNHISYLDPPLVGSVIPRKGNFMARKGLFNIPVLGWIIKGCAFPVDREKPRPSTIKEAVQRLKNGELVVMFPEGRRSDTGHLQEGKRGLGMVASLSKVPVIPTLLIGSDKALPIDAAWLKRAKITVVFGRPIYYTSTRDVHGRRSNLLHEDLSKTIMTAIREMQEEYAERS